ncbi:elongation factor Ts [Herbihabitans rhizosphaerae]|uniref:Elongation factor Ts n=2 Tax=Herbihabitans rhizosphaerae TaxID=1872711 RepID=A0A4Q7KID8_9PSEU|nr:elongation factor Ts [Herbihabitans rhizosphaerae]
MARPFPLRDNGCATVEPENSPARIPKKDGKATMANYTAADVKRLRDLTGSGMMDCKKALEENDGDFDKAVEYLRIKGAKDVGKRAERATANGLVASSGGALIELNCETDFVAKNAEFVELANKIAAAAQEIKAADVDSVKSAQLDGKTVDEAVQELSAKIGEKLELRRVAVFDGQVATYLHRRASDLPPAVGVLVEYTGADADAARAAAMQVAALKAKYVSRDDVPEDIVANERHIAEQTAREEGKPEQALPKIVEGRVNGFFKDVALLEQPSVQESKKTVKAVLDDAGVQVTRFARFEVGQA